MQDATDKPELRVTVFSDYICPFCYVGSVRLEQLRDEYDLRVNWCFLEIHPDTPAAGMPIESLGYAAEQRRGMMENLDRMAAEESISLAARDFTTNSHQALLMAEAAKLEGKEVFYAIHNRIFEAFFVDQANIGDVRVLTAIARQAGMSEQLVNSAWMDPRFESRLRQNLGVAGELGVRATPTYFIGERRLDGAVPTRLLREAAEDARRGGK